MANAADIRWSYQLPIQQISKGIENACSYTARGAANDLKEHMIVRFEELKHGAIYYYPEIGEHQASAPGEYPAVKFGILERALGYTTIKQDSTGCELEFGVMSVNAGSTFGVSNSADYALDLEFGTWGLAARPYFVRAMLETFDSRAQMATQRFNTFMGNITSAGSDAQGISMMSGDAKDLERLLPGEARGLSENLTNFLP